MLNRRSFCAAAATLASERFSLAEQDTVCPGSSSLAAISSKIQARIDSAIRSEELPGIIVLVQDRDCKPAIIVSGWQDRERRLAIRANTLFDLRSLTKPVTALAALVLVKDGKLSLDEPAETYLPEIGTLRMSGTAANNPGRRVTLRRLLTHTAGFSQTRPEALSQLTEKRDQSLSEVVDLLLRAPLDSKPGQKWLYSSPGYAVVGRLIEVASRVPFAEFVRERVLKPLKMVSTCFTPPQSMRQDLATLYEWKNGRIVPWSRVLPALEWTYPAPEFGLYSTAADVARLCLSMFKGNGILPEPMLASALAQTVPTDIPGLSDGLGWFISNINNCSNLGLPVNCFGHNGASGTMAWANPNSGRVVVFLTQCFFAPDVVGTDVTRLALCVQPLNPA